MCRQPAARGDAGVAHRARGDEHAQVLDGAPQALRLHLAAPGGRSRAAARGRCGGPGRPRARSSACGPAAPRWLSRGSAPAP